MKPLIRVGPVYLMAVPSDEETTTFLVGRRDGEDALTVVITKEATSEMASTCSPADVSAMAAALGYQVLHRRAVRAVRRGYV